MQNVKAACLEILHPFNCRPTLGAYDVDDGKSLICFCLHFTHRHVSETRGVTILIMQQNLLQIGIEIHAGLVIGRDLVT